MKTTKYIHTLLITAIAVTGLTLSSCHKDKDETPTPANGTIAFHLHTNADTAEVEDYDSINVMSTGRKITVHKAQLYISSVQLIKLDGTTYDVPGVYILKRQQEEVYSIANVPSGNYKSVRFNVGLSSAINATTPVAGDSTLNQPAMWFGATAQPSGFVFVNFQGTIDTTTAGNGTVGQMQPFNYMIGTNSNLKSVTLPNQNYTVSPNQVQFIHMIIDYNKLFTGIPLNVSSSLTMNTTGANAGSLGAQLTNNIPLMFSYEE